MNLVAFIILVLCFGAYLVQEFKNVMKDKNIYNKLHIVFSTVILITLFCLFYFGTHNSLKISYALSLFVTFGIGVVKEIYDKFVRKTGFSWGDIARDIYGIVYGTVIVALIIAFINLF